MAFTLIGGKNWTGGYNYLLNLLKVLANELPGQVRAVLMVGADVPDEELSPFREIPGCECVRVRSLDAARRTRAFVTALLLGRDAGVSHVLSKHEVDVVFEAAAFFGWRLGWPAIAWLPDLQHRELPRLFPRAAWWRRELGHRAQLASSRTVMLSSEDSRNAFARHYPRYARQARVVRFAVAPTATVGSEAARAVADRYGLPAQYFFMPNQYWVHKNHALVVEALAILRGRGLDATVVAAGRQFDPRDPGHFLGLEAAVREAGLASHFVMPGLIPQADMAPLMEGSMALINPSLFEGWSTTVEEARALGVPMLLSDLAVHREQAEADAIYFDRYSAESLADAVASFRPLDSDERAARRKAAHETSRSRMRKFAEDFVALVREVSGKAAASVGRL